MNLALVIPCHGRYELTEIGLDQKLWLQECVRNADPAHDVQLQVFVVSEDDKHKAMAEARGFRFVPSDNSALGKRWNDGYQEAANEDYDMAMPCGSDSWLHPELFYWLPWWSTKVITVTTLYSLVEPTGKWRSDIEIIPKLHPFGVGFIWNLYLAREIGWRPCAEQIARGCDTSTLNALIAQGGELHHVRHRHLEYVAFQSGKQITNVRKITARHQGQIVAPALDGLRELYPPALVDRVADYYKSGRSRIN